mgnify:CR=1 FL=1
MYAIIAFIPIIVTVIVMAGFNWPAKIALPLAWLLTCIVGFAFWKGGKLHLLHASSSAKKVIEDPKTQYESSKNTKAHIGLRAIRFVY